MDATDEIWEVISTGRISAFYIWKKSGFAFISDVEQVVETQ